MRCFFQLYGLPYYGKSIEYCFYIESNFDETKTRTFNLTDLKQILSHGNQMNIGESSIFDVISDNPITEFGPNLTIKTTWGTTALSILRKAGIKWVNRIERSIRTDDMDYYIQHFDKMRQVVYESPLVSFHPEENNMLHTPGTFADYGHIFQINPGDFEVFSQLYGLGLDDIDITYYTKLFQEIGRSPTNAELLMLTQLNSEHSRHRFFNGRYKLQELKLEVADKHRIGQPGMTGQLCARYMTEELDESLMTKIKTTHHLSHGNSLIAFSDNASAILGTPSVQLSIQMNILFESGDNISVEKYPNVYLTNRFVSPTKKLYHPTLKAETHNFPTMISPFEGAATGVGGRIRDNLSIGQGGVIVAGIAGYCVGNCGLEGHTWEKGEFFSEIPYTGCEILIQASNGASDYGNKVGEPIIQGFTRSFGDVFKYREVTPSQNLGHNFHLLVDISQVINRREWLKPVMFSAGLGFVDQTHLEKEVIPNHRIIRAGGPAYRIGMSGASASSRQVDSNNKELDFQAVQRGDPSMANKLIQLINTCVQLGFNNPIRAIHDQGAGGMANVSTEILEDYGGVIYMDHVTRGDDTLSDLETWISEHQEQVTLTTNLTKINILKCIADREGIDISDVGYVSESGDITALSSINTNQHNISDYLELLESDDDLDTSGTEKRIKMVDLPIKKAIDCIPQKKYEIITPYIVWDAEPWYQRLANVNFRENVMNVLHNINVCSKQFLTNKVDRSVSGLIAQQQCVGINQVPLSDYAIISDSYFGSQNPAEVASPITFSGVVSAVGEQPLKGFHDIEKMVSLSIGEMLTNIIWAYVEDLTMIKCNVNWMWDIQSPHDKYLLWKAVTKLESDLSNLHIGVIGGKDSLSMSVNTADGTVKSPYSMVVSGYVTSQDITKKVNPAFTKVGSRIIYVNLGGSHYRLGGSILSVCLQEMSNTSPEDIPEFDPRGAFDQLFHFMQVHIRNGNILSGHDVSDGGLITTLLEMSFGNNIGCWVAKSHTKINAHQFYFSEDPGLVFEVEEKYCHLFIRELKDIGYPHAFILGHTQDNVISVSYNAYPLLDGVIEIYKQEWQKSSFAIEKLQANPDCIDQEIKNNILPMNDSIYFVPPEVLERLNSVEMECKLLQEVLNHLDETSPSSLTANVAVIRCEGSNGHREMMAVLTTVGFQVFDIHMNDLINQKVSLACFHGIVFVGGFSYGDVLGAGQGWASSIVNNIELKRQFDDFYQRKDTFSLGVCNGCQLMSLLGWTPFECQFIPNQSERFESRYHLVKIPKNNSIMLQNMEGLQFGIWSAHGEGQFSYSTKELGQLTDFQEQLPIRYIDNKGYVTEQYPFNPNGSPMGIAGVCSKDGRHLAMMPHPERSYMNWQLGYCPPRLYQKFRNLTPWVLLFKNAYNWCQNHIKYNSMVETDGSYDNGIDLSNIYPDLGGYYDSDDDR